MYQAGNYNRRFVRVVQTLSKDSIGQDVESYADGSSYWGSLEERSGQIQMEFGMRESRANAVIKIRQWPTLNMGDRLRDTYTSQTYFIDAILRPDRAETVVLAHQMRLP